MAANLGGLGPYDNSEWRGYDALVDASAWDQKYRGAERLWSVAPNQFVARELAELAPGTAIDLAAGEGRNALWLAERGWQVTAVDFSSVAIDRGKQAAAERSVEVRWLVDDVHTVELSERAFDLVLIAYLQLPWEQMDRVLRRAAAAVAPGGTFFLIGHDARNLSEGYGGPQSDAVLYGPEQVSEALAGLDIVRAATVERIVETAEGERTALDCLVRARRG